MIKKRAFSYFIFVVFASCFSFSFPAFAQHTAYGHITSLQTGSWGEPHTIGSLPGRILADDTMAVDLDVPFVNSSTPNISGVVAGRPKPPPTPCKVTTGGYALDPKDAGTRVNESVLLSAFLAGKKVSLFLDGCIFDKPRIVSVSMSTSN
jgi:hypothetical protein